VYRADLDRALDVAGGDLRAEKSHQLLLVNDGAAQENRALDDDRDGDHQQEQNRPHPPSTLVECVGQHLENDHQAPPSVTSGFDSVRYGGPGLWPSGTSARVNVVSHGNTKTCF